MSGKGNCSDNAPMESFWGTLKTELVFQRHFKTREEAIREITEYIDLSTIGRDSRKSWTISPQRPLRIDSINYRGQPRHLVSTIDD